MKRLLLFSILASVCLTVSAQVQNGNPELSDADTFGYL